MVGHAWQYKAVLVALNGHAGSRASVRFWGKPDTSPTLRLTPINEYTPLASSYGSVSTAPLRECSLKIRCSQNTRLLVRSSRLQLATVASTRLGTMSATCLQNLRRCPQLASVSVHDTDGNIAPARVSQISANGPLRSTAYGRYINTSDLGFNRSRQAKGIDEVRLRDPKPNGIGHH
jgi:hypothetical protein